MRTIKFRGKRYGDGAWVYGNLYQGTKEGEQYSIILDDAGYDLAPEDDRNLAIAFAENEVNVVFPDTVGQFTGLLDQNGKEIYEGDILIEPNIFELPRHVFWDDRFARWGNISPTTHGYIALHDYNRPEIIGNIHDNPELLKL